MDKSIIITRRRQQFGGLFIFVLSFGFIMFLWFLALYKGYFYAFAGLIFPAFAVVGLGLVLFPDYKTERIARGEDISQLEGIKLLTRRWWVILVIGLICSVVNSALLKILGE